METVIAKGIPGTRLVVSRIDADGEPMAVDPPVVPMDEDAAAASNEAKIAAHFSETSLPKLTRDYCPTSVSASVIPKEGPFWDQPVLSDTLFPPVRRADTPMIKLTLSGTIELTQEQYQAYLDGARLGPGAVVEVRAVGYVVQPGAAWTKRRQKTEGGGTEEWWEREGRLKIKLVDIGELTASGEEWSEA